jgi:KipI family sensor histidine kinase inhibitor
MGRLTVGRATPRIEPIGEAALLVVLGDRPDPAMGRRAHALAAAIEAAAGIASGIGRPVPAHASVLVPFDPLTIGRPGVEAVIARAGADNLLADPVPAAAERPLEIPVTYGGSSGPDLEALAEARGLRPSDVIEIHATARFHVLFLGFAPGFAYLGGLPAALATPRRTTPRERVPPGSVAIAGEHSAVYPLAMPGGWNVIGRTEAVLFDPRLDPPTPLRPGRSVRFVPR